MKLVGSTVPRDAIGTWINVQLANQTLSRQMLSTRGYLSQSELLVTFGLGDATEIETLTIRWPHGSSQTMTDIPLDQLLRIKQNHE